MTRVHHLTPVAVALATVLTLGGCGGTETAKTPAMSSSGPQASPVSAPTGLSGEEFVSKAESLSGSTVILERCSLLTTPGSDGALPCRVLNKQGTDITDASGLPVGYLSMTGVSLKASG